MAVLTSANYLFLPWVRQGAAAGIKTVDMTPDQPGVVSIIAELRVNDSPPLQHQVRLYGPGDVTGIDAHSLRRPRLTPAADFVPGFASSLFENRKESSCASIETYRWQCSKSKSLQCQSVSCRIYRNHGRGLMCS